MPKQINKTGNTLNTYLHALSQLQRKTSSYSSVFPPMTRISYQPVSNSELLDVVCDEFAKFDNNLKNNMTTRFNDLQSKVRDIQQSKQKLLKNSADIAATTQVAVCAELINSLGSINNVLGNKQSQAAIEPSQMHQWHRLQTELLALLRVELNVPAYVTLSNAQMAIYFEQYKYRIAAKRDSLKQTTRADNPPQTFRQKWLGLYHKVWGEMYVSNINQWNHITIDPNAAANDAQVQLTQKQLTQQLKQLKKSTKILTDLTTTFAQTSNPKQLKHALLNIARDEKQLGYAQQSFLQRQLDNPHLAAQISKCYSQASQLSDYEQQLKKIKTEVKEIEKQTAAELLILLNRYRYVALSKKDRNMERMLSETLAEALGVPKSRFWYLRMWLDGKWSVWGVIARCYKRFRRYSVSLVDDQIFTQLIAEKNAGGVVPVYNQHAKLAGDYLVELNQLRAEFRYDANDLAFLTACEQAIATHDALDVESIADKLNFPTSKIPQSLKNIGQQYNQARQVLFNDYNARVTDMFDSMVTSKWSNFFPGWIHLLGMISTLGLTTLFTHRNLKTRLKNYKRSWFNSDNTDALRHIIKILYKIEHVPNNDFEQITHAKAHKKNKNNNQANAHFSVQQLYNAYFSSEVAFDDNEDRLNAFLEKLCEITAYLSDESVEFPGYSAPRKQTDLISPLVNAINTLSEQYGLRYALTLDPQTGIATPILREHLSAEQKRQRDAEGITWILSGIITLLVTIGETALTVAGLSVFIKVLITLGLVFLIPLTGGTSLGVLSWIALVGGFAVQWYIFRQGVHAVFLNVFTYGQNDLPLIDWILGKSKPTTWQNYLALTVMVTTVIAAIVAAVLLLLVFHFPPIILLPVFLGSIVLILGFSRTPASVKNVHWFKILLSKFAFLSALGTGASLATLAFVLLLKAIPALGIPLAGLGLSLASIIPPIGTFIAVAFIFFLVMSALIEEGVWDKLKRAAYNIYGRENFTQLTLTKQLTHILFCIFITPFVVIALVLAGLAVSRMLSAWQASIFNAAKSYLQLGFFSAKLLSSIIAYGFAAPTAAPYFIKNFFSVAIRLSIWIVTAPVRASLMVLEESFKAFGKQLFPNKIHTNATHNRLLRAWQFIEYVLGFKQEFSAAPTRDDRCRATTWAHLDPRLNAQACVPDYVQAPGWGQGVRRAWQVIRNHFKISAQNNAVKVMHDVIEGGYSELWLDNANNDVITYALNQLSKRPHKVSTLYVSGLSSDNVQKLKAKLAKLAIKKLVLLDPQHNAADPQQDPLHQLTQQTTLYTDTKTKKSVTKADSLADSHVRELVVENTQGNNQNLVEGLLDNVRQGKIQALTIPAYLGTEADSKTDATNLFNGLADSTQQSLNATTRLQVLTLDDPQYTVAALDPSFKLLPSIKTLTLTNFTDAKQIDNCQITALLAQSEIENIHLDNVAPECITKLLQVLTAPPTSSGHYPRSFNVLLTHCKKGSVEAIQEGLTEVNPHGSDNSRRYKTANSSAISVLGIGDNSLTSNGRNRLRKIMQGFNDVNPDHAHIELGFGVPSIAQRFTGWMREFIRNPWKSFSRASGYVFDGLMYMAMALNSGAVGSVQGSSPLRTDLASYILHHIFPDKVAYIPLTETSDTDLTGDPSSPTISIPDPNNNRAALAMYSVAGVSASAGPAIVEYKEADHSAPVANNKASRQVSNIIDNAIDNATIKPAETIALNAAHQRALQALQTTKSLTRSTAYSNIGFFPMRQVTNTHRQAIELDLLRSPIASAV
ncbi:MAG: hypothetical protein Tsb005_01760 [Gammaproteobacteria bacterium]